MEKTDQTSTTLWVRKATAIRLRRIAEVPGETYDGIIRRLLNYREIHELGVRPELLKRSSKKG